MLSAIALWVEDNGEYSFAHRSLQEYFAAYFMKTMRPEFKEKVYSKLAGSQNNSSRHWSESKNLLSLCEEMDTLNYYELYLLPILYNLRGELDTSTDLNLIKSFLCLLFSKFSKKENYFVSHPDFVNPNVFKHLNITEKYILELDRLLIQHRHSKLPDNRSKYYDKEILVDTVKLTKRFSDDYLDSELNPEILQLAKRFHTFITDRIKFAENYISQSDKSDKVFIKMI